jgi:hypothetical protein
MAINAPPKATMASFSTGTSAKPRLKGDSISTLTYQSQCPVGARLLSSEHPQLGIPVLDGIIAVEAHWMRFLVDDQC